MADERSDGSPDAQAKKKGDAIVGANGSKVEMPARVEEPDPQPLNGQTLKPQTSAAPEASVPPVDHSPDGGAHPSYYSEVAFVDNRLDFKREAGAPAPPPAYREFRRQVEDVARLVRMLFQDDKARLTHFFRMLHITADSGLRGPHSSLDVGADNLQDVKDSIADEFPAVRGKIWWWNFGLLVAIALVCGLASTVLHHATGTWVPVQAPPSVWPSLELAAFLIPMGVLIGLFVEFIFRVSDDVPYDQLRAINPGRWKPFQRAFNTVLVAYSFAAILAVGAFQVGVASVLLNDFIDKKPELSLAIGFVTGFAFPFVRDLVQQFRPVRRDGAG